MAVVFARSPSPALLLLVCHVTSFCPSPHRCGLAVGGVGVTKRHEASTRPGSVGSMEVVGAGFTSAVGQPATSEHICPGKQAARSGGTCLWARSARHKWWQGTFLSGAMDAAHGHVPPPPAMGVEKREQVTLTPPIVKMLLQPRGALPQSAGVKASLPPKFPSTNSHAQDDPDQPTPSGNLWALPETSVPAPLAARATRTSRAAQAEPP